MFLFEREICRKESTDGACFNKFMFSGRLLQARIVAGKKESSKNEVGICTCSLNVI